MTNKLDSIGVLEALCKATGRWGMYVSFCCYDEDGNGLFDEIPKAAPFLNYEEDTQIFMDGEVWILCDSEEEARELFDSCVGDDGPTHLNPYDGEARVYALTCDSTGQYRNENT